MKFSFYYHRAITALLWGFSFSLPFAGWIRTDFRKAPEGSCSWVVSWLSLPIEMAGGRDPLDGWDELIRSNPTVCKGVTIEIVPPQYEVEKLNPSPGSRIIRLYGIIAEADSLLYCFHDAVDDRWFSMETGECNESIGLKLMEGVDSSFPKLVDLESGEQFMIQSGEWFVSSDDANGSLITEPME